MTEHQQEVLEKLVTFLESTDKETREKLIFFCEGVVSGATAIGKEEKTA